MLHIIERQKISGHDLAWTAVGKTTVGKTAVGNMDDGVRKKRARQQSVDPRNGRGAKHSMSQKVQR